MFAMSHDYRIMLDGNFKIQMSELKNNLGVPKNMGASLKAKLKPSVQRDLNLFGLIFDPKKALKEEVIDQLVTSREELSKKAIEKADQLKELGEKRLAFLSVKGYLYDSAVEECLSIGDEKAVNALQFMKTKL